MLQSFMLHKQFKASMFVAGDLSIPRTSQEVSDFKIWLKGETREFAQDQAVLSTLLEACTLKD